MKFASSPCCFLLMLLLLLAAPATVYGLDEARFADLITKMEGDALEMAKQVELLYEDRCNIASLGQCAQANFNDCLSVFPTPTCPASPDFAIAQCASSSTSDTNNQEGCSGLYDFEHSTVALPSSLTDGPGRNPTDAKVIETICFTRELDSWFINKQESDRSYWQGFDVESPQMYFGSHNGIFRKFPGSSVNTKECGRYDPRVRPWYVAASSGPKNIIMILDTSGSMKDFNRLPLLKEAAKRVIDTLAVGDRIAIVDFATKANFNSRFLLTATDENKKKLRKYVDRFTAIGRTNFLDAFEQAFDILDASIDDELAVRCNTALLFLTDGEMTEPAGVRADDVLTKVNTRIQAASAQTGRPVVLFTYSVGADPGVATLPSALACSVEFGVWSKIDRSDKIVESLASYYRLFALGLGSDVNADFNAWVEPYVFAGSGQLGTTVSVPVYDRSKTPNLFLGVVGVDFPISALDKALGVESGENGASVESVGRISDASTARCPVLELTPCELESYRILGSNEARCNANCTAQDFVEVEEGSCVAVSDYPRNLWANIDNSGKGFGERVCCQIGTTEPSDTCAAEDDKNSGLSTGSIIGIAVGSVALALLVIGGLVVHRRRRKSYSPGYIKNEAKAEIEMPEPMAPPAMAPGHAPSAPVDRS